MVVTKQQREAENQERQAALEDARAQFPELPVIVSLSCVDHVDWTGDPSLWVTCILSENTKQNQLTGERVMRIKRAIFNSLQTHGIDLFPYVTLAKESELRETDDEEDEG